MLNQISKWKDKIAEYVDLRVQLIKLGIIDRASNILSYFIFTILCLFLVLAVLIFFGMGMGEYFNKITGSYAMGYFITGCIYLVLFGILIAARNMIVRWFSGMFVRILTEEEIEEVEDKIQKDS